MNASNWDKKSQLKIKVVLSQHITKQKSIEWGKTTISLL